MCFALFVTYCIWSGVERHGTIIRTDGVNSTYVSLSDRLLASAHQKRTAARTAAQERQERLLRSRARRGTDPASGGGGQEIVHSKTLP